MKRSGHRVNDEPSAFLLRSSAVVNACGAMAAGAERDAGATHRRQRPAELSQISSGGPFIGDQSEAAYPETVGYPQK